MREDNLTSISMSQKKQAGKKTKERFSGCIASMKKEERNEKE